MTTGTWTAAITIGRGGTRAQRSPDEQRAWADRVRGIQARADACMLEHGATPESLARPTQHGDDIEPLRRAAGSFFATLTTEQIAAITPASRGGEANPGTVIDLWEGASVYPDSDNVRCYDEYVPIAEALWPPEPTS